MAITILKNHPDSEVREYDVLYEGRVLATREVNGYDDSDFVALCWDDDKGEVVTYTYASTRFWTYCNGAKVDATDDLRRLVADKVVADVLAKVPAIADGVRGEVAHGATVKVTGGRKYIGREGKVFWKGTTRNQYNRRDEQRVGVDTVEGDRIFLPLSQVTVTVPARDADGIADEVAHRVHKTLSHALWESGCGIAVGQVWDDVERALRVAA